VSSVATHRDRTITRDIVLPFSYLNPESSDPVVATYERTTYVPLLAKAAFLGGDDFLGSARERIFVFANGQTGLHNPQAQEEE